MAVAALPPGKKSPIDSMRSKFRGLKNNIKSTFTREPGGNKDLEKIRNVILKSNFDNLSLIMFFFASRFALLSSIKKFLTLKKTAPEPMDMSGSKYIREKDGTI